ncbi:hypothetical protein GCM10027406_16560 [Leifsonia lichenia]
MPNEPNAVRRSGAALSRSPDLARLAAARARERGWQSLATLAVDARELRQVVLLPEYPHPVVMCVRVRSDTGGGAASTSAWETAARSAARSEHVVGVLAPHGDDVARGGAVEFLMLEHALGGTLSALLDRRRTVRADEAATILIGVALGLGALHEAGWSVGGLTSDGIAFRRDGCPAIDGLRHARPLTGTDAVADAVAYRAVADRLSTLVPAPGGWRLLNAVDAALAGCAHAVDCAAWERVVAGVLAVVEPGVVHLGDDLAGVGDEKSSEVVRSDSETEGDRARWRTQSELLSAGLSGAAERARLSESRRPPSWTGQRPPLELGRGQPDSAHGTASSALSPLSAYEPVAAVTSALLDGRPLAHLTGRVRAWLAVRKKLVAVAVAPVIAVGAVLVLLPGAADGAGSGPAAAGPEAEHTRLGSENDRTTSPPAATPTLSPSAASALSVPGDPVGAAPVLLRARHACFAATAPKASCLNDIVQDGSPLAEADRAALDGGESADRFDYAGAAVELVQRWGDAALVSVAPDRARTPKSEPASLLMVRSEAGWRLREVFP